jgi:hypothetical protein
MSHFKTIFAISLASAGVALFLQPAEAQNARRNLTCIALPVLGFLSGAPPQQFAIVNNTSQTIAAGTVYTYAAGSGQRSQASPAALAAGQIFHVYSPVGGYSAQCAAWIMVPFKSRLMTPLQNAPALSQ